jgi:hypothetical protein
MLSPRSPCNLQDRLASSLVSMLPPRHVCPP